MKQLYLIILILLCFIFVLGCVNVTDNPNNETQPNSGETTEPIQNDDPSDTTVADETKQSSETSDTDKAIQPDETDDTETASPVTLAPDETIPPQPIDPADRTILLLEESNKLYNSFEKDPKDPSKVVYPDDYAGSGVGDDGYLNIMLTSLDNVDYYKAIVDPSLIRFHVVKNSLNQLVKIIDAVEPKMQEFKLLYPPHINDNIIDIETYSEDMIDDIKAFLDAESIDPDLYEIIIYEAVNGVIPQ